MEEPTTKPSGSNPASPSSTYSDTDRSEVKTPPVLEPAVFASRPSAMCGSHAEAFWFCWLENCGIVASPAADMRPLEPSICVQARTYPLTFRESAPCVGD